MAKKFEITGLKEIDEVLKGLPEKMTKQVLTGAYRKAAKPLLEEMQRLVPQYEGDLQDSLGMVAARTKDLEKAAVYVGPRNRPANKYVGWRSHFAEFGTINHPAQPFIRPAFDAKISEVKDSIKLDVAEVLLRTMKRTIKKAR